MNFSAKNSLVKCPKTSVDYATGNPRRSPKKTLRKTGRIQWSHRYSNDSKYIHDKLSVLIGII